MSETKKNVSISMLQKLENTVYTVKIFLVGSLPLMWVLKCNSNQICIKYSCNLFQEVDIS